MVEEAVNRARVRYLDIAKGISLLLVMISHSCGMPFGSKYFTAFYIQIFFVLSGVTYKRRNTVSENVCKRFKGVIIPYFIYNLIIVVINVILGNLKTLETLIEAVIGSLYSRYCFYPIDYTGENRYFMQIGNSPLWFLTAMFLSSCIFYYAVEWINEKKRGYICSVIFILLTILLEQLPILLPWSIDTAFLGAYFMLVGYYGKRICLQEIRWKTLILALVMYTICCYYNEGINISIRQYGNYGGVSVLAVCIIGIIGTLLCINLSKKLELIPMIRDILDYIGKNTIMFLALHVTIFSIFDNMLNWIGICQDVNGIVYYGVGAVRLVVTIGVCYCISCVKKSWIAKASMH